MSQREFQVGLGALDFLFGLGHSGAQVAVVELGDGLSGFDRCAGTTVDFLNNPSEGESM